MNYLSNPYNEENNKAIFEKIILVSIILILLQFISEFSNTVITTGYFILPIIYLFVKYDYTKVNIFKKSIVHCILTLGITLFAFSDYEILYESMNIIYLLGYITIIYQSVHDSNAKYLDQEIYNFISVYCFYILAGSCVCIFYLIMNLMGKKYEVSSEFILGGFDFFVIVFITLTLFEYKRKGRCDFRSNVSDPVNESTVDVKVKYSDEATSIIKYFERSEAILEPGFDLEQLAKSIGMNKAQVSEIINQEMDSSFYQLLALYRINHAKSLISENKNLTMEAVVDKCGFSSTSTFNKYFKFYVGQTPSVYRRALV